MRVFHELSDEEIASTLNQRTLAVLAALKEYPVPVVLPTGSRSSILVVGIGGIAVCAEVYQVFSLMGKMMGAYQSATGAVRKLMEKGVT